MNIDEKLDLIITKIDFRFDAMDKRFDALESRMDALENRMDVLESRMDALENRVSELERELSIVKNDVTSIKLQIENELIPNIKRVAEGHQDLQRRFEEAVTYRSEYETLVLRVNHLETEVENIQKKIS